MKYAISFFNERLQDWDFLEQCRTGSTRSEVLYFESEVEAQDHLDDLKAKFHPIRKRDSQVVGPFRQGYQP